MVIFSMYSTYLICYDISDNKRRNKLFECLKDLGLESLQESVFYGFLKHPEYKGLKAFIRRTLKKPDDKCLIMQSKLTEKDIKDSYGYKNFTLRDPDGFECI